MSASQAALVRPAGSVDRLVRLAGDPDAYAYLPSSVKRLPAPHELAARMDRCGLDVRYVLTAGGIIALHVGKRREQPEPR